MISLHLKGGLRSDIALSEISSGSFAAQLVSVVCAKNLLEVALSF
jgi:hypothetical protein